MGEPVAAGVVGTTAPAEPRLRLWPAVPIVLLQWAAIKGPGLLHAEPMTLFNGMFFGPMVGAAGILAWWLFASRLRWRDRFTVLGACVALGGLAFVCFHPSFGGFGLVMYSLPVVTTAWVAWLVVTPRLRWPVRQAGLLCVLALAWGYFVTLRFDGVTGTFSAEYSYRWTPTAEERTRAALAARKPAATALLAVANESLTASVGDWPCFRGPERDSRVHGVRIATDWSAQPPKLLWKQPIGPGWSSFAVVGGRVFTQEQRDADEVVVCYDADSGAEVWLHRDSARFTEVIAGPGPRATPTFVQGKLYTLGANGKLNCLDAGTGKAVWSRDIVADSGAKVPMWGFSSSPLVAQGIVTVFAGGPDGKSVLGYQAATGDLAWAAGRGQLSYCSPQLSKLGGVEQVLIATDAGLTSFQPADGQVLWHHDWTPMKEMARIVQPAVLNETDVLLGTGMAGGTRRLKVTHDSSGWNVAEAWTSLDLKPYFNDFVVHGDHLYGFDNGFFLCVSLANGKKKWKVRGYDNGQVLLLPDQDLLLILSEKGDVALVETNPNEHKEIARIKAIEGKTWNHPVVAHGKLLVRNGEEIACFQLTEAGAASKP